MENQTQHRRNNPGNKKLHYDGKYYILSIHIGSHVFLREYSGPLKGRSAVESRREDPMVKKITRMLCAAVLTAAAMALSAAAVNVTAAPSSHQVYVDGERANVAAYLIDGNNYFKLRDVAAILNGTDAQFEVEWVAAQKRINLTDGRAYTFVGDELTDLPSGSQTAVLSNAAVYKDGAPISYQGYNIAGNNFYKLRDIASDFDFGIEWDAANQHIMIRTGEEYTPEDDEPEEDTPQSGTILPDGTHTIRVYRDRFSETAGGVLARAELLHADSSIDDHTQYIVTGEATLLFTSRTEVIDDYTYRNSGQGQPNERLDDIRDFFTRNPSISYETVFITVKSGALTRAEINYHP